MLLCVYYLLFYLIKMWICKGFNCYIVLLYDWVFKMKFVEGFLGSRVDWNILVSEDYFLYEKNILKSCVVIELFIIVFYFILIIFICIFYLSDMCYFDFFGMLYSFVFIEFYRCVIVIL